MEGATVALLDVAIRFARGPMFPQVSRRVAATRPPCVDLSECSANANCHAGLLEPHPLLQARRGDGSPTPELVGQVGIEPTTEGL